MDIIRIIGVFAFANGQYWMAVLYLAYIASAVYGYCHWKKKGVEI